VPADLNDLPLDRLYETLASDGMIRRLFELARDEDLGEKGDLTSKAWFTDDAPVRAHVSFREPGIVAGIACIEMICDVFAEVLGARVSCEIHLHDGERADKDAHAATIEGPRSAIVGVERTVLNIVGRLSGIATLAAKYVEAASTGKTRLLDTRKTTPGLRALEKYAVRCGGGHCHRMGLHDAVLVKDNHIAGLTDDQLRAHAIDASARGRELGASFIEIEVDRLEQLDALLELDAGAIDIVLLDNMSNDQLREAVAKRDARNPSLLLEASGGVRLETVGDIAATGVDRISVGALTHSAISLDVGLDADAG